MLVSMQLFLSYCDSMVFCINKYQGYETDNKRSQRCKPCPGINWRETKLKAKQLVNLRWVCMIEFDECWSIFHRYVFLVISGSGIFTSFFPHSLCSRSFLQTLATGVSIFYMVYHFYEKPWRNKYPKKTCQV